MSGFAVMKKAPSHCKKILFQKMSFQFICADKILKTVCGNVFRDF